nr:hypothetical protein GCM10020241_07080 [Streptoalloteichus tenebrarius]
MPETAGSLRNTLALTGLALMTSVIAGATRSWTTPLFFLMVCLLFGPRYDYAPTGGPSAELWAIVLAPPHDLTAAVLAGIVWLLGTALFILRGARAEIST